MSEFWARKIKTYFDKFDINHDGFVTKDDMEHMAERLCAVASLGPEQVAPTKELFVELWRKFMKSAGSDDNGALTVSILVLSLDQQKDDPEFKETFLKFAKHVFGVRDLNGDGYLSEDEYLKSFAGIGIKDLSFVHSAFEYIDVNKDGKLSLEEYSNALLQYLITDDEHLLWGPLD